MDRQKILIGTLSGILTISVLIFVYQRIMKDSDTAVDLSPAQAGMETKAIAKPLPTTPSAVADEIESQAALDDAAIEAEVNAETSDVQEDSESLNSLSQSYDENQI